MQKLLALALFSLSIQFVNAQSLQKGDRVLADTYSGTVLRAYGNGTVDVKWDINQETSNWKASELREKSKKNNGFVIGQKVLSNSGYSGIILTVTAETAEVKWENGLVSTWDKLNLFKSRKSLKGFEAGQIIITYGSNYEGEILTIYENETADIRWKVNGEVSNWPLSDIAQKDL